MRIVTAADHKYFHALLSLLGSIIHHYGDRLIVSVYDIGMKPNELAYLRRIPIVELKEVQKVNPQILTPIAKHPGPGHRTVPGSYSWKPVCVFEELVIHHEIFWLDAGTMLLKPIDCLFSHTRWAGHFFIQQGNNYWQTPASLARKFQLGAHEMQAPAINSAMMGYTDDSMAMVEECYFLAHDVTNFVDDGTAGGGPDSGRHDQTVFSIVATKLGRLPISAEKPFPVFGGEKIEFAHIAAERGQINEHTIIYHCRQDNDYMGFKRELIKTYGQWTN